MTSNQLKYFVTAAETLSFTEAGKRHFISQTAITQHIQSLEEQLGVKLFVREKKAGATDTRRRNLLYGSKSDSGTDQARCGPRPECCRRHLRFTAHRLCKGTGVFPDFPPRQKVLPAEPLRHLLSVPSGPSRPPHEPGAEPS